MNTLSLSFSGIEGKSRQILVNLALDKLERIGFVFSYDIRHCLFDNLSNLILVGYQSDLKLDSANLNFANRGTVYRASDELAQFLEAAQKYVDEFKNPTITRTINVPIEVKITRNSIDISYNQFQERVRCMAEAIQKENFKK